jgi:hypothetical protein
MNDRGKLLRTFNCDILWVSLMNDKEFVKVLMATVLKDAKSKARHVKFCGLLKTNEDPKPFKKGYANIYLVEDDFLHWSCCIIEDRRVRVKNPVMIWYDPSDELSPCVPKFDHHCKDRVINKFEKMMVLDLKTPLRSQQFCSKHPARDIFSSTWCAMFASVYINNAFDLYARIDFVRWQTQPLKMWVRCLITRLPSGWQAKLKNHKYKQFFSHCRRVIGDKHDAIVERLPSIHRESTGKFPCVYSILLYYLGVQPVEY